MTPNVEGLANYLQASALNGEFLGFRRNAWASPEPNIDVAVE